MEEESPTLRGTPDTKVEAMEHRIKSQTAGGKNTEAELAEMLPELVARFPVKLYWFLKNGYNPHLYQTTFHFATTGERITRFRHLVAGRRGGKTLSAAWEVLFYALHPAEFHRDVHGTDSSRPLWIWALAKDYKLGRPSLLTFLEVIRDAGLVKDKDYTYNKVEKVIEFKESGTLLEFKTADDPQSLRGAGLDILWIDEAAFVPNRDAWDVVRPALADKLGTVITTTTPIGENWFYQEFWSDDAIRDPSQFSVEYCSIDNPHFPPEEWEKEKRARHPVIFKREYMASFKAMHGVELEGDWLHYYTIGQPDNADDIQVPRSSGGKLDLRTYIGIDPAVSLADTADYFAMVLIGVTKDNTQAFLLDVFKERLAFPDQLDKIREWQLKYRPQLIGIESNAYQRALVQQASRLDGFPGIVPIMSRGKKWERILAMAPLFKIGKIRIHRNHRDFIDEWLAYDSNLKNPKDDVLDAVEIALGVAGVLLPLMPEPSHFEGRDTSVHAEAMETLRRQRHLDTTDPELGSEV